MARTRYSVRLQPALLEMMDAMVEGGLYESRAELTRAGIRTVMQGNAPLLYVLMVASDPTLPAAELAGQLVSAGVFDDLDDALDALAYMRAVRELAGDESGQVARALGGGG